MNEFVHARYISPARRKYMDQRFVIYKKQKLKFLIELLYNHDCSNRLWYSWNQKDRNIYLDKWINNKRTQRGEFCKCRKINVINNWINNMKI